MENIQENDISVKMGRRIATIQLTAEILLEFCKSGKKTLTVESDIPQDAVVVGANYNAAWDAWELAFTSPSLNEVKTSSLIPILPPPSFTIEYEETNG